MNNQGFVGALVQYWTVNDKPRLDRKNTYFDDVGLSNINALRVGIVVSVVGIATIGIWSLMGVIL